MNLTYKDLEKGFLVAFTGGLGLTMLYSAGLIALQGYINVRTQSVTLTVLEFGLIGCLGIYLAWRNWN